MALERAYEGSVSSEFLDWRKPLVNATFVLSIFAFLQVLPITAEIQPYAFVPAALLIVAHGSLVLWPYLVFFFGLSLAWFISLVLSVMTGVPEAYVSSETYVALLIPATIFAALYGRLHLLSRSVLIWCVAIWTFVGITQVFLPNLQSALGLDTLLSALISRYSRESLSEIGRGATLLASEPSYSAYIIVLFLVSTMGLAAVGKLQRKEAWVLYGAIAFLAWANQSATVLFLLLVVVLAYFPFRWALALAAGGIASAVALAGGGADFRALDVVFRISEMILSGEHSFIELTNTFGSIRGISVWLGYTRLFDGHFIGTGLGSWSSEFLQTMERAGIQPAGIGFFEDSVGNFVNVKPAAHAATLVFDLGVWGLLLEAMILAPAFRLLFRPSTKARLTRSAVLAGLVCILLTAPISLPAGWIMLAWAAEFSRRTTHGASHRDGARGA